MKFLDIKKMENFSYTQFYEMKNVWKRERERERRCTCVHTRLSATLFQIESHEPTWFMACKLGSTTSATLSGKS